MKKIRLIALFAAVIAGICIYQFLQELGKPQEIPRKDVVVALTDIRENTLITEEMIGLKSIPTESLMENCMYDTQSVVGKAAGSTVYAGEQLTKNRLIGVEGFEGETDSLAYRVKPGMRAVTISVDASSGISALLKPKNHVDLIWTYQNGSIEKLYDPEEKREDEKTGGWILTEHKKEEYKYTLDNIISETICENVEILALGNSMTGTPEEGYTQVTLLTTQKQAEMISGALAIGMISLTLRSPLDEEICEPEPAETFDMTHGQEPADVWVKISDLTDE